MKIRVHQTLHIFLFFSFHWFTFLVLKNLSRDLINAEIPSVSEFLPFRSACRFTRWILGTTEFLVNFLMEEWINIKFYFFWMLNFKANDWLLKLALLAFSFQNLVIKAFMLVFQFKLTYYCFYFLLLLCSLACYSWYLSNISKWIYYFWYFNIIVFFLCHWTGPFFSWDIFRLIAEAIK